MKILYKSPIKKIISKSTSEVLGCREQALTKTRRKSSWSCLDLDGLGDFGLCLYPRGNSVEYEASLFNKTRLSDFDFISNIKLPRVAVSSDKK